MSFDRNMRLVMAAKNISVKAICEETGSCQCLISYYSLGQRTPRWYRAIDIADVLGVSLDWLFDRKDRNEQPAESTLYGDLIQEFMEVCGVPAIDVYNELNISPCTMDRIKKSQDINMKTMIALADYFDTSLDFLAGRGPQTGLLEQIANK